MAMQLGGGGGVKSDINVTPLVDVMLVLLIIVMIIAPLIQQGAQITLPTATNTSEKPETQGQTVLSIDARKQFFLNSLPVPKDDLQRRITELLEDSTERIVIIKADADVEYSAVMDAMDQLRASGIEDMGLITEPKKGQTAPGGE